MNNQITLAYLDHDDLDALQVVSVVSFYESFIDGADPLDMQEYLQTQLTTETLAVELAQSTSKFIGIKDHHPSLSELGSMIFVPKSKEAVLMSDENSFIFLM